MWLCKGVLTKEVYEMDDKQIFERALLALSEIYISIYEFDIEDDALIPIKSNKFIDELAAPFEKAQDKLNNVMKNITVAEHQDIMMEFSNLSTLNERLKDKKDTSLVFRGKINGWCRARYVVMEYGANGSLKKVLYTVENINEEKIRENHLLYLSQTDLLTGIYNRGYGEKVITEFIENKQKGLFIILDVDKFKSVNDKYGHQVGDQVLIKIASAMQSVAREQDIVMRLGGDEFAGFFPGVTDKEEAEKVINNMFEAFDKIEVEQMSEPVAVSLGARIAEGNVTFEELYKSADKGVYVSKTSKGSSFNLS